MAVDRSTVCFDLDHTLCRHRRTADEVLGEAFERVGVDRYCHAADLRAVIEDVPSVETDREFYEYSLRAAAEHVGTTPTAAGAVAAAYDSIIDHADVEFLPGARMALETARASHRVALVTNGSPTTQRRKLEALGITDAFDVCVFGEPSVGFKPEPGPFEQALTRLGASPEEALHVGDSLYADVGGATGVGMDVAWVQPPTGMTPERFDGRFEPTYSLESLTELEDLL